jgi:hypothetical protein
MKTRGRRSRRKPKARPKRRARPRRPDTAAGGETSALFDERQAHPETSPTLTGGDVDADWQRALSSGEEAVGGSVATPDQDVVDELGRALGVEQPADAEVHTSDEILKARDRHYWHIERRATERDEEE